MQQLVPHPVKTRNPPGSLTICFPERRSSIYACPLPPASNGGVGTRCSSTRRACLGVVLPRRLQLTARSMIRRDLFVPRRPSGYDFFEGAAPLSDRRDSTHIHAVYASARCPAACPSRVPPSSTGRACPRCVRLATRTGAQEKRSCTQDRSALPHHGRGPQSRGHSLGRSIRRSV